MQQLGALALPLLGAFILAIVVWVILAERRLDRAEQQEELKRRAPRTK